MRRKKKKKKASLHSSHSKEIYELKKKYIWNDFQFIFLFKKWEKIIYKKKGKNKAFRMDEK